jgi:integrase
MGFGLSTASAWTASGIRPARSIILGLASRLTCDGAAMSTTAFGGRAFAFPPDGRGAFSRRLSGGPKEQTIEVSRAATLPICPTSKTAKGARGMQTATITRAWARNLPIVPAGKRQLRVFDNELRGFFAEVYSTGGVVFRVRYSDERGRRRDVKIGWLGEVTVDQARERAVEIRGMVASGRDPAAERDARRAVPTVEEFVEEQYGPHVREQLRAADDYMTMLRLRILPAIGKLGLDEVTRRDIVALKRRLVEEGLSNGRVNRHLCVVRSLFNLSTRWGVYEGRNPAEHPGMLREEPRELFLNGDQVRTLMENLARDPDRVAASAVALLLLTGCRKSEVLKASWQHVDLENGRLTVPLAKGNRRRFVALSRFAVELLAAQPRQPDNPFVFPSSRRPGQPIEGVRGAWGRAKQGLPPAVRLHDLRHTYASILINSGSTLHEVSQLLGHTMLSTTQRYSHLAHDRLVEAAGRFAPARNEGEAVLVVLDVPGSVTLAELVEILSRLTVVAAPRVPWERIAKEPPGSLVCQAASIVNASPSDPRVASLNDPRLATSAAVLLGVNDALVRNELTLGDANVIMKWANRQIKAVREDTLERVRARGARRPR